MPDYDAPDAPDDRTPLQKSADERQKTALARFKLGVDARDNQRKRETEALKFQVPELMWPAEVKAQRAAQVIGGINIPARPMLSIPSLDQPVQLVLNQEKNAHLGVTVHPVSEDADDDTAEVLQGLYRRIEVDSRANLARSFAFERGVKCGTGEYEVVTEYDDEGGHFTDQKISIKRILHQGSVVRDPFAQEPDQSDGMWAFKKRVMAWDTYTQKYPKSKLKEYSEEELNTLGTECEGWITGDGAGRAIQIAAYYEIRITKRRRVLLDDGSDAFDDEIPAGRSELTGPQAASRDIEVRTLWYSIINAIEELEPASEQNGKYIPLIFYSGRELIPFDDERRWVGIPEPNMDSARLINYGASSLVENAALETKAPYMLAEGQEVGHEQEFGLANIRNFPYIRYKPTALLGTPIAPPQRTQIDTSRLGPSMMLLERGEHFIHVGTGAFEAALGQSAPENKTKGGLLALQAQHDQGNSNFLSSLGDCTIPYEAKVVLDLIPHVYDRPGRVAQILDKEDNRRAVILNAPFIVDPKTKRPMRVDPQAMPPQPAAGAPSPQMPGAPMAGSPGVPPQPSPPKVLNYNLKAGHYGYTVGIGKAYKSRMEEGADEIGRIIESDPGLMMPLIGPLYFKFRDIPGHEELAKLLKKLRAKQFPGIDDDEDNPEASQQRLAAAQQQVQMLTGELQKAADMIKTEQVKHQAQVEIAKFKETMAFELQKMKDATAIRIKEIDAQMKGVLIAHEAEHEAVALGREHAFTADQAERDRQHELQAATLAHQQAMQQGEQGVQGDAALAEQGHQQTLEQGDQAHQATLQQQEQAAELAPEPSNGSGG